jgi:hypothetical protein
MALSIFGICMAIAYEAPWWVWIIGLLCVMADAD